MMFLSFMLSCLRPCPRLIFRFCICCFTIFGLRRPPLLLPLPLPNSFLSSLTFQITVLSTPAPFLTLFPPSLLLKDHPSYLLPSIQSHPLIPKIPFPADRDSIPEMSNLVLAPLLILIKLISSLFEGSNGGIHYCIERLGTGGEGGWASGRVVKLIW